MTAYRQQALGCAAALKAGPLKVREIRDHVPEAAKILQGNVYGWFERVERGVYGLTPVGLEALSRWTEAPLPLKPDA